MRSRGYQYRATADWPYDIASGGAVYKIEDNKILVLVLYRNEPDGRHYHLPKGTLHFDETLENCAQREISEESGAAVELRGYLGAFTDDYISPNWHFFISKTTHYFAAEFREFTREHDSEHDGVEFLPLKATRENLMKTEPEKRENLILDRLEKFLRLANKI